MGVRQLALRVLRGLARSYYPRSCLVLPASLNSQMGDIQVPIGSIGDENIAIRSMRISDFVNLNVRRKNIYDHRVIHRNYAGTQLFSRSEERRVGKECR